MPAYFYTIYFNHILSLSSSPPFSSHQASRRYANLYWKWGGFFPNPRIYVFLLKSIAKQQLLSRINPGQCWHTSLLQALWIGDRIMHLFKFEASPVYRVPGWPELCKETLSGKIKNKNNNNKESKCEIRK